MSVEIIEQKSDTTVNATSLKIGQLGIIRHELQSYNGKIVLRIYNSIVMMDNPRNTWSEGTLLMVDPLPIGTSVKYTSESFSD